MRAASEAEAAARQTLSRQIDEAIHDP
jgi:hypothetical protein